MFYEYDDKEVRALVRAARKALDHMKDVWKKLEWRMDYEYSGDALALSNALIPFVRDVGSVAFHHSTVTISGFLEDGYKLKRPFRVFVYIEPEGRYYWATGEIPFQHAVGDTPEEAVDIYKEVLVSYFKSLVEDRDKLGGRLSTDLEIMETHLIEPTDRQ